MYIYMCVCVRAYICIRACLYTRLIDRESIICKCIQRVFFSNVFLFFYFFSKKSRVVVKKFYEAARAIPAVSFRSLSIVTDILYSRETNYN